MNTIEVFKILKRYIPQDTVFGVYPIDLLPTFNTYPTALVVNLDKSDQSGSHWVALYFKNAQHCDYFDSYGFEPNDELKRYISRHSTAYTYNNVQAQEYYTTSCGHMCIYFLIFSAQNISFRDIVESMTSEQVYKYFQLV